MANIIIPNWISDAAEACAGITQEVKSSPPEEYSESVHAMKHIIAVFWCRGKRDVKRNQTVDHQTDVASPTEELPLT